MCFLYRIHNGIQFFLFGFIDCILSVNTHNRTICGNFHNVHCVDITKFLFFRKCCTGHAGLLIKFIKEILECNGCKCFAFTFYLYMLFCFNCLVKTIRIATARHDTSGKLIHDHYLIILDYIILIPEHQIVGT